MIGDFNARTSTLNDFVTTFPCNFDPNSSNDDFDFLIDENFLLERNIQVVRKNKNTKTNDFGHRLVNMCSISGLIICNGRLQGDNNAGNLTYFDKKGKSTNDYCLISKDLLYLKNEFYVFDPNVFSDHVPILFKLVDINIGSLTKLLLHY